MKAKSIIMTIILSLIVLFIAWIIWDTTTTAHNSLMQTDDEVLRLCVRDGFRRMIGSYKILIDTYTLYKDSEDPSLRLYADEALVRASQLAHTYNENILKYSYMWEDKVPKGLVMSLPTNIK